ncbi:ABC multidrug transporter [Talaromyces proteolyticus]|uniref:ABC multidrug transporter n=1 Tax=Talaromyces proteolyticus TaxID=1131652 RepID=A0AAD4KRD7_9EURO|nr:ABC multidrug transporter [Talaromyces proteolyticus]KAH8696527.1 ABC multidrug transporter [Talaromyces proteolyticus]
MYSDKDGSATLQSQTVYRSRIRLLLPITNLLSWAGFGIALLRGDFASLSMKKESILEWDSYLWPLLIFNSLGLYRKDNPIDIYAAALRGLFGSALITVSQCLRIGSCDTPPFSILSFLQLSTSALLALVQTLFPRRPDVFMPEGKLVDREGSSSAFQRYSMQWCTSALLLAGNVTTVNQLPVLNFQTRSKSQPLLGLDMPRTILWDQILTQRFLGFAKQWTLMLVRSAVSFGSPYCVMQLLNSLESDNGRTESAWIWLIGLGVFSTMHTVINHHLIWIQWSEMGIPVRAQLIMSIFQKALRMKDVKSLSGKTSREHGNRKTRLADKPEAINLISTDTLSFSKFTAVNYIIPSLFIRFFFAMLFLVKLIGWQSTLVGIFVTLACIPVHAFVVNRQRAAVKKLTGALDKKTQAIVEALNALRQIKFSASETQWEEYIHTFRDQEIEYMDQNFKASNIKSVWGVTAPFLVAGAASFAYTRLHGGLKPSIIFPMIELLPHLQGTLGFAPFVFQDYFGARVNAKRMDRFLRRLEHKSALGASPDGSVTFRDASIAWPIEEESSDKHSQRLCLHGVSLEFPVGQLSIITGKTGSGKSLLLSSIIGEADILDGQINAPSMVEGHPVAFVSQTPWLQNVTIKENILFHSLFDAERYDKVLTACALTPDLLAPPKGDEAVIGLRGVKLSGGQRARLSLARGLYSSSQLLVMDDIFSSLDALVSREVFNALTGELGVGRTRILATHQVSLCLPKAKYFVQLENNTIKYAGDTEYIRDSHTQESEAGSDTSMPLSVEDKEKSNSGDILVQTKPTSKTAKPKARTDLKVYMRYFAAAGGVQFTLVFFLGLLAKQLLSAVTTWLLGRLNSSRPNVHGNSDDTRNILPLIENVDSGLQKYFYLYLCSSISAIILEWLFNLFASRGSIRASKALCHEMTYRVLRMPLLWIDNTPFGDMLKRFTAGTRMVDDLVLGTISEFTDCFVKLVVVIGVGLYTSQYTIFLTIALLFWCARLSRDYIKARTTVKHADSRPTADILEHFTSSTAGISTIRAFGTVDQTVEKMHQHIDKLSTARRHFWIFNRWLGLQMSFAGILFSMGTAVILLSSSSVIPTSVIGWTLTFSTEFSQAIFKAVNSFGVLETHMEAARAVLEYGDLENEDQAGHDVPTDWPSNGKVEVNGLDAAYSPTLPRVLNDVTFTVEGGQKIGIVGRTGAGKSSLTLSLLRLLTPINGSISIDGIDISTIKLQDLRSRVTFIPQDPVLFSGTVRTNLDYFGHFPEERLKQALRRVKLFAEPGEKEVSSSSLFTLDSPISAGGSNISQGQRQLFCLARALTKNTKIIILDEAISAVDSKTDALIRETIISGFNTTLIVVAHRLSTIASFDRVMVMSDGKVAEIGEPARLLKDKGLFYDLVQDSEDKELLVTTIANQM